MKPENSDVWDYENMSMIERVEMLKTLADEMALLINSAPQSVFGAIADDITDARRYDDKRAGELLFDVCEKAALFSFRKQNTSEE